MCWVCRVCGYGVHNITLIASFPAQSRSQELGHPLPSTVAWQLLGAALHLTWMWGLWSLALQLMGKGRF